LKRRVLAVVLAVLLAVLGAGAILAYVRQADQRALQGQKAVTVVVALKTIPSGTSLRLAASQGLVGRETFPASSVPANAVPAVTPNVASLVVSYQIPSGTVLIPPMLVTAAQAAAGGGVALPTGQVAVTIAFCVPEAVAGSVRPGSLVDVVNTFTVGGTTGGSGLSASAACSGSHQQSSPNAHEQVVLTNMQVLSVGPAATGQASSTPGGTAPATTTGTATDSPASSTGTVLVTFAATVTQAKTLVHLSVTGLPYLLLVRA
jgi:pilus assembly protein CpaB